MSNLKITIGEDAYKIIEISRALLNESTSAKYKFITEQELENAFKSSPKSGNQVSGQSSFIDAICRRIAV